MTTYLFSLLTVSSDRMMQTDPHGWTLTLISVSVVFLALLILFLIYSLIGGIASGSLKKKAKKDLRNAKHNKKGDLAPEQGWETEAAIAAAIHLYLSEHTHDAESGIVTICAKGPEWGDNRLNFRILPRK